MARTPRDSWSFGSPHRPLYMRPRLRRLASIVAMTLSLAMITSSSFAAVSTDKWEYEYGETVQITGDEMTPGEEVSVDVSYPDGSLAQSHFVTADVNGNFDDSFYMELGLPAGIYLVTATGLSSGIVFTTDFDPTKVIFASGSAISSPTTVTPGQVFTVTASFRGDVNSGSGKTSDATLSFTGGFAVSAPATQSVSVTNFNTVVTRSWTVTAPLSGSGMGTVQLAVGPDSQSVSVAVVNPDTSAPTVTISSASGSAGTDNSAPFDVTTNSNPTITWSANESGTYAVKTGTCAAGTTLTGTNASGSYTTPASITSTINLSGLSEGSNTVRVCVTDAATNTGSAAADVLKDTVAPSISAALDRSPDTSGWFNSSTGAPTVEFTCSDAGGSGVASCPADHPLGEGENQSHSGTAYDVAGNSASDGVTDVDVDLTAPTISIVTPPAGANYALNQAVAADYSCTDVTSGPPSCTGNVANSLNIDTSSVGAKSFTVNAEDQAGNTATQTNGYNVSYVFSGFFQPVDNYAVNSAKAGQAIPVKWRLTDASGAGISDPGSFRSVSSVMGNGACGGYPTDLIEEYAAGSSGLQYLGDGYWQFNWKTPMSYAGQCRTMRLYLNDGTTSGPGAIYKTASFQFK